INYLQHLEQLHGDREPLEERLSQLFALAEVRKLLQIVVGQVCLRLP
ncbi:hypothetical protein CPC197_0237B, partial [Chlamydia psittaci C1/97]